MKKCTPLFVLALALLLAGCASGLQHRQAPSELDTDYMNTVERSARQVGVDVRWINPPMRPRVILENEG